MTVAELAQESGVGVATIKRLEACDGLPSANSKTLNALKTTLERLGVGFVGSANDAPGVRLMKASSHD